MTGYLDAFGGWRPGITHPDPVVIASTISNLQTDAVTSGDFGGTTPSHTPTVANQIAFDTSDGNREYRWTNGAWNG